MVSFYTGFSGRDFSGQSLVESKVTPPKFGMALAPEVEKMVNDAKSETPSEVESILKGLMKAEGMEFFESLDTLLERDGMTRRLQDGQRVALNPDNPDGLNIRKVNELIQRRVLEILNQRKYDKMPFIQALAEHRFAFSEAVSSKVESILAEDRAMMATFFRPRVSTGD